MTTKEQALKMLELAEKATRGPWLLAYIALQSRVEVLEGALKRCHQDNVNLLAELDAHQENTNVFLKEDDVAVVEEIRNHIENFEAALHPEPATPVSQEPAK